MATKPSLNFHSPQYFLEVVEAKRKLQSKSTNYKPQAVKRSSHNDGIKIKY